MKRAGMLLTFFLVASTAMAAEKWWDFYNRGLTAGQSENWGSLSENMQQAIAMKPAEELNARARNDIIVYVPHFWLGIAKYNLGDVDGALHEWDVSQSQGVIRKTRYYSELRAWVSRAQVDKAKKVAAQSAGNRKNADAALSKALTAQADAMAAGADRTEGFRSAQRKLTEAFDQFGKARNDARAYDQAASTAAQASKMFAAVTAEAKQRKSVRPAPKPAVAQTPAPAPVAAPPVEKIVAPPVVSQALADARVDLQSYRRQLSDIESTTRDAELRRFVTRASDEADDWDGTLQGNASDAEARKIVSAVHEKTRALENRIADTQMKAAPPAGTVTTKGEAVKPAQISVAAKSSLKRAYLAFAQGSIDESEAALTQIIANGDGVDQAYLLRGCVRYTKGMLRKDGGDFVTQARDDFRRALTMNPALGLDSKHFSPKLVSCFKEVQREQMAKK